MAVLDDVMQMNQMCAEFMAHTALDFAETMNPGTQGWMIAPVNALSQRFDGGRLSGRIGQWCIGVSVGLLLVPVFAVIVAWGLWFSIIFGVTVGAFVGGGVIGCFIGGCVGLGNFLLATVALAFVYHGLKEDDARNVFGGASWADDLDAISQAGLKGRR